MATKKKTTEKKAKAKKSTKKTAVRKAARKAASKKQKVQVGSGYECVVCGLGITVDTVCGCVEYCDIICCNEQMVPR